MLKSALGILIFFGGLIFFATRPTPVNPSSIDTLLTQNPRDHQSLSYAMQTIIEKDQHHLSGANKVASAAANPERKKIEELVDQIELTESEEALAQLLGKDDIALKLRRIIFASERLEFQHNWPAVQKEYVEELKQNADQVLPYLEKTIEHIDEEQYSHAHHTLSYLYTFIKTQNANN